MVLVLPFYLCHKILNQILEQICVMCVYSNGPNDFPFPCRFDLSGYRYANYIQSGFVIHTKCLYRALKSSKLSPTWIWSSMWLCLGSPARLERSGHKLVDQSVCVQVFNRTRQKYTGTGETRCCMWYCCIRIYCDIHTNKYLTYITGMISTCIQRDTFSNIKRFPATEVKIIRTKLLFEIKTNPCTWFWSNYHLSAANWPLTNLYIGQMVPIVHRYFEIDIISINVFIWNAFSIPDAQY